MIIEFEGQRIEVPDDASDAEIEEILNSISPAEKAPAPEPSLADTIMSTPAGAGNGVPGGTVPAPAPEPSLVDTIMGALDYADNTGAVAMNGARRGMAEFAALPGLLVDAANNAPRLLNLLPGVENVGAITDRPLFGYDMLSDSLDTAMRAPAEAGAAGYNKLAEALGSSSRAQANRQPEDAFQRVAYRVGKEIGATAVPVGGALTAAARVGVDGARRMGPLARHMVEPAAVAPATLVAREGAMATGAGMGAGIANEIAGNPQEGDNFWSDLAGSIAGAVGTGTLSHIGGSLRNVTGAALGRPQYMDDVAAEEVAARLMANSSEIAEQQARFGTMDSAPLAARLRTPSEAERAVPGYVANVGDRSQDPTLMTFNQNVDMLSPGAANVRRTANNAAIDERMGNLAPTGDAAEFRIAVENGRDRYMAQALEDEELARAVFGEAFDQVQPTMPTAEARGSTLRAAAQDAYDAAQAQVHESWRPINEAGIEVDIAPLRNNFRNVDEALPLNDRQRFRPAEADVPARLAPEGNVQVPFREITSLRSGLSDDIRAAQATGQRQAARVGRLYRDQVDEFMDVSIPPDLRGQYDTARAARRDLGDRFERPGTAIAETLRPRDGGYQMHDSAVASRFAQPDSGHLDDVRALLREAGNDPRARTALADEIMAQVNAGGLLDRPNALNRWLGDRKALLDNFPELRTKLEHAGATREAMTASEKNRTGTERRLTTPGRSAIASYLKYGDEATVDAVRTVVNGPKPAESIRELLDAAGNAPEARVNARTALWEVVKKEKYLTPDAAGGERWNMKRLKSMFDDPKFNAVAKELWADNRQDLDDIKKVFSALAGSEGSIRTRAAGSSGTAQALRGKLDPSLTTTSVASRIRSVKRGQLSPTIAVVDLASTWLRNRSAKVQARAIDTLTSAVVNNPGLAADLLERYNPADWAARRRMITQKYGVRVTQVLNLLDNARAQDDTRDAILGDDEDREALSSRQLD